MTALPHLYRFRDLKAANIVDSRTQLRRLQERFGFPAGRLISPNTRAWTGAEIEDWYASRPSERKTMSPAALRGRVFTKQSAPSKQQDPAEAGP